jgi:plasmid maintenance system antidote protein VapI
VESNTGKKNATFGVLQARLIQFLNTRIQNGDFTERGLARVLGVSQPQIHNVLKGARTLKPDLADRMLEKLGMDVTDLLKTAELTEQVILRHAACVQCPNRPVQIIGAHLSPLSGDIASAVPRKGAGREISFAPAFRKQAC